MAGTASPGLSMMPITEVAFSFCQVLLLPRRMAWWLGVPAALLVAVGFMWGPLAAALGVTQALLAIFVLEDVNYIEHYGLQRGLTRTGR